MLGNLHSGRRNMIIMALMCKVNMQERNGKKPREHEEMVVEEITNWCNSVLSISSIVSAANISLQYDRGHFSA